MKKIILKVTDYIVLPLVPVSACIGYLSRRLSMSGEARSIGLFGKLGVLPIINHYYEPSFNYVAETFTRERFLPGIRFDVEKQLQFLKALNYWSEFNEFLTTEKFDINNGMFGLVDSFILYSFIRKTKPNNVVEIGGGFSSIVVHAALKDIYENSASFSHIVIEPYPRDFLTKNSGITLLPQKVEETDFDFSQLDKNDLLLIDSSHVFNPQGDVDVEYLQILPLLKSGCFVHLHDIFTPYHYPKGWLSYEKKLWNEQYILEALLTGSNEFSVVLGNFLICTDYRQQLYDISDSSIGSESGCSFYIQKC